MQKVFEFMDDSVASQSRRHRRPDPETSTHGADRAERRSGRVMLQVLSMASDAPMTANELADLTVQKYGGLRETCRKRAMELSKPDDGRLTQVGTKVCRITGSEAAAFVLTSNGR